MKTKIIIYVDVWSGGYVSAYPVQPVGNGTISASIPAKSDGVRRYRVVAEVDDPMRVDADAPATTQEEP